MQHNRFSRFRVFLEVSGGVARGLFLGGVLGCLAFSSGCNPDEMKPVEAKPVPVDVCLPVERPTFDYKDYTGRIQSVESVDIRARVTGYLETIHFQEGVEVKKGDLLIEIDHRPFVAVLDQAVAQIKLCEADLAFRKAEFQRAENLLRDKAMSQSDYDQIKAAAEKAAAAVESAKATAEQARLNVEFTYLKAPIGGKISRALVTKGNLVTADQTLLTTIVSVDPMYVYFNVDEKTILDVQEDVRGGKVRRRDEGEKIPVWMGLDNETGYPHEGFLNFMENEVDATTGTIQVRGEFANPKPAVGDRLLTPGLFARLRLPLDEPYQALMVPERALGFDQGQRYLLIVNDKNQVEYRKVALGRLDGELRVVKKGVQPNEKIAVGRLQYIRPGMTVVPKIVSIDAMEGGAAANKPSESKTPQEKPDANATKPISESNAPKPAHD